MTPREKVQEYLREHFNISDALFHDYRDIIADEWILPGWTCQKLTVEDMAPNKSLVERYGSTVKK